MVAIGKQCEIAIFVLLLFQDSAFLIFFCTLVLIISLCAL